MSTATPPTAGVAAPYGGACQPCARAKCRCVVFVNNASKCERCNRLNKDCQPSDKSRKRRTTNKSSTAKVNRLEEKLDGLVNLLTSVTHNVHGTTESAVTENPGVPNIVQDQLTPESIQSLAPTPHNPNGNEFSDRAMTSEERARDGRYCPGHGLSLHVPVISADVTYAASGTKSRCYHSPQDSALEPGVEDAEAYLKAYMEFKYPYFPLMILPEGTTALQLRQERPFLWLCVMAISTKTTEQQKALSREIRLAVGREMLLEGKNNHDLLMGLLIYSAWGHYHIYDKPIITFMLHLAMGLVANLGLKKMPPKEPPQMMLEYDARGCPKPFNPSSRNTEERRTALMLFYISSVCASYFQRIDAFQWNAYLDECLRLLENEKQISTDALLVQIIKLQLIAQRVAHAPWNDDFADVSGPIRAPSQFYLGALQQHMQDFKQQIPGDLLQNRVLLLHLYNTELVINEVALAKEDHFASSLEFQRIDCLYACLNAIKNWFDVFLCYPPRDYIGISLAEFTQLAHCIIGLYRLSTFDWREWDRNLVRNTANISTILGELVSNFAQVKTDAGLDEGIADDRDIFSITSRTLNDIKTWWDSKLAAEDTRVDATAMEDIIGDAPINFLDDAWLQDVLGTGPYRFESFG